MKNLIALILVLNVFYVGLSQNQPSFHLLNPEIEWQSTNMSFTNTDTLNIFASGFITNNISGQNIALNRIYTPAGLGRNQVGATEMLLCPDCPVYSLIGRIGINGDPFYMGVNSRVIPEMDGELYVAINDGEGNFADNTGCWVITIYNGGIEGEGLVGTDDPIELLIKDRFKIFPNPSNDAIEVEFSLAQSKDVKFELFSIEGKLVTVIRDEFYQEGINKFMFDVNYLSRGKYLIVMSVDNINSISKRIILK